MLLRRRDVAHAQRPHEGLALLPLARPEDHVPDPNRGWLVVGCHLVCSRQVLALRDAA